MTIPKFASPDVLRADFAAALSAMYRTEVPLYGDLLELVGQVNRQCAEASDRGTSLDRWQLADRVQVERHGAIRLGTYQELSDISQLFHHYGMFPVNYYDLTSAGLPVHSTAFRPLDAGSLSRNPFRVFTSLIRLDLVGDAGLRDEIKCILGKRDIIHPDLREMLERANGEGGVRSDQATDFVRLSMETFRWHSTASVSHELYLKLKEIHPILADTVSFRGPHINHLTPRVLDIDAAYGLMNNKGIPTKKSIEGPPVRHCPILLRQTSFLALSENILFVNGGGDQQASRTGGSHRARFGEIESRGAALTPKGHELYLSIIDQVAQKSSRTSDNETIQAYLQEAFVEFPDDWESLRRLKLAYFTFEYSGTTAARGQPFAKFDLEAFIANGSVTYTPIVYEDFLPASAAGIFSSNLGKDGYAVEVTKGTEEPSERLDEARARSRFTASLRDGKLWSSFELYEHIQRESLVEAERQWRSHACSA